MHPPRFVRKPLVLGALFGAAAVASGVAIAGTTGLVRLTAAQPGSVVPLTACVHNGNSQLRLAADAAACGGDTALRWDAVVGSPVAGGSGGGAVGDVYTTTSSTDLTIKDGETQTVLTLPVPAGHYAISSKVVLFPSGGDLYAICDLRALPATFDDQSDAGIPATQRASGTVTLANQLVASLATPGMIELSCNNPAVGWLQATNASITALVVGAINTSP